MANVISGGLLPHSRKFHLGNSWTGISKLTLGMNVSLNGSLSYMQPYTRVWEPLRSPLLDKPNMSLIWDTGRMKTRWRRSKKVFIDAVFASGTRRLLGFQACVNNQQPPEEVMCDWSGSPSMKTFFLSQTEPSKRELKEITAWHMK